MVNILVLGADATQLTRELRFESGQGPSSFGSARKCALLISRRRTDACIRIPYIFPSQDLQHGGSAKPSIPACCRQGQNKGLIENTWYSPCLPSGHVVEESCIGQRLSRLDFRRAHGDSSLSATVLTGPVEGKGEV